MWCCCVVSYTECCIELFALVSLYCFFLKDSGYLLLCMFILCMTSRSSKAIKRHCELWLSLAKPELEPGVQNVSTVAAAIAILPLRRQLGKEKLMQRSMGGSDRWVSRRLPRPPIWTQCLYLWLEQHWMVLQLAEKVWADVSVAIWIS